MKILILGLNFAPELTGAGRYTGELAFFLAQRGAEVHAVTTFPYYPAWKISEGYSNWWYQREELGGVMVYRCPLWVPAHPSNLKRIVHLLSFTLSSLPVVLGQVLWKPDIVLCVVPALLSAPSALIAARLAGARAWLHIQDFEMDAAFSLGMMPSRDRLQKWAAKMESVILRSFDRVSTISEKMVARTEEKGIPLSRVTLFPNWVDTRHIFPMENPNPLRSELGISPDKIVLLYHGNMGRKQGLEILLDSAVCLRTDPRILFVLCGMGAARSELETEAADSPNVRFLDVQPEDKLNALVNMADIHVLPQLAGAADLVMPSKLATMLASGRAIIACADAGTQIWKVVQQAGHVVPPQDTEQLVNAIVELANNPAERSRLGQLARAYAEQYLDREMILGSFWDSLLHWAVP